MTERYPHKTHTYSPRNNSSPTNSAPVPLPGAWPAEGELAADLYRCPPPYRPSTEESKDVFFSMSNNFVRSSLAEASSNTERCSEQASSAGISTQQLLSKVTPDTTSAAEDMRRQETIPVCWPDQSTVRTRAGPPQPAPISPSTLQVENFRKRKSAPGLQERKRTFSRVAQNSNASECRFDKIHGKAPASMRNLRQGAAAFEASAVTSNHEISEVTYSSVNEDPKKISDTQRQFVSPQSSLAPQTCRIDPKFKRELHEITTDMRKIKTAANATTCPEPHSALSPMPVLPAQPYNDVTLEPKPQVNNASSPKSWLANDFESKGIKQSSAHQRSPYQMLDLYERPSNAYWPSPNIPMNDVSSNSMLSDEHPNGSTRHRSLPDPPPQTLQPSARESVKDLYRQKLQTYKTTSKGWFNPGDVGAGSNSSIDLCVGLASRKNPPPYSRSPIPPFADSNNNDERVSRARCSNNLPNKFPPHAPPPYLSSRTCSITKSAARSTSQDSTIAIDGSRHSSRTRDEGRDDEHRKNRSRTTATTLHIEASCNCRTMCRHVPHFVVRNAADAALNNAFACEQDISSSTEALPHSILDRSVMSDLSSTEKSAGLDDRRGRRFTPRNTIGDDEMEEESANSNTKLPSVKADRKSGATAKRSSLDIRVTRLEQNNAQDPHIAPSSRVELSIYSPRTSLADSLEAEFVQVENEMNSEGEREDGWDVVEGEVGGESWMEWLVRMRGGVL